MAQADSGLHQLRRRYSLSCIVPVYNEGESIRHFIESLHEIISRLTPTHEIIVVNDGSVDQSGDELMRLSGLMSLQYIELSRNFGKEHALQAGLDAANGDCVLLLDADWQHPLNVIPDMVTRWQAGADMVYAVKSNRDGESWLGRLGSRLFYRMLPRQRGVVIPKDAGDFRLLDAKVVDALRAMPERNRFMKGMYAWVGFKSEAIEFTVAPRIFGRSKFGPLRLLNLAVTGLTSFSNSPLRVVTLSGMAICLLSLCMATWLVSEKLFLGQPIPGFATLSAGIFFFSGVQLLAIGIVGEYVGRIFDEVKQRPGYLVARRIDFSTLSAAQQRRTADRAQGDRERSGGGQRIPA